MVDERPPIRAQLPFRRERDSITGQVVIQWNAVAADGQKIPFYLTVGDNPNNPLAGRISELLDLAIKFESELAPVVAERDQMRIRLVELERIVKDHEARDFQYKLQKAKKGT